MPCTELWSCARFSIAARRGPPTPAHPAAGAVSPTMSAEDLQHQVAGQSVQPQVPAEMDRTHRPNGGRQNPEDAAVRTAEGGASRPGKTLQEVQGHSEGEPQELQH